MRGLRACVDVKIPVTLLYQFILYRTRPRFVYTISPLCPNSPSPLTPTLFLPLFLCDFRIVPFMSSRTSDRCHWRGNPFPRLRDRRRGNPVIPSQSADWRGNPHSPKAPLGALYIIAAQRAAPTFCGALHRKRRDLIIAHPTRREFPKGEGAHALSLWTLQGDRIFKGRGKFGIPLPLNGVFGYFCRCWQK